ncbi:MAG: hypothetical protein HRU35_01445 [Rickettsiaceae bacterium]|nr:hypothetical protein [Rickettsiaceae bacterium]
MFGGKKENKQLLSQRLLQRPIINKVTKMAATLVNVLENENNVFKQGMASEASKIILQKKVSVIEEFEKLERELEQFAKNNHIDKSDPALKKLGSLFNHLKELSNENEILLQANINVNNRIIEQYQENCAESTIRQFGYNNEGVVPAAKNLEKVMPAISLNNKV